MADREGKCRICKTRGPLDPHHSISRGQATKRDREDLSSNQGNIVWICRDCHDMTCASITRKYLTKKAEKKAAWVKKRGKRLRKGWGAGQKNRCEGDTKMGRRCRAKKKPGTDYCATHRHQAPKPRPDAEARRNMEEWELATLELEELIEGLGLED